MPQLFCILEEGGRALLTRAQGDIQTPSFPTIGLLSSLATYSQNAGYQLQIIGSSNVRIVYRRFENHLLFVLVTGNLLLHTELLQHHLLTIYEALCFLLGSSTLSLDTSVAIDALRKKLRGVQQVVDSLIADDTLVPCFMLPVPQVTGLPLREKATLHAMLERCASMLQASHAALVGDGYYLAATQAWWEGLSAKELLLAQHLAASQPHGPLAQPQPQAQQLDTSNLVVHLKQQPAGAAMRLRAWPVHEGIQLLALLPLDAPPPDPELLQRLPDVFAQVRHVFETPLWLMAPVPQFSTITFDLALIVERSPACATLLWGHTSSGMPQGFNPLMSPTLRRQMASSPSPANGRMRSPSNARGGTDTSGGAGASDNLQLYFKSAVDTLVSFVLQTWPHMPPAAQASLHQRERPAAEVVGAAGAGAGTGAAPADGPASPLHASKSTSAQGSPGSASKGTGSAAAAAAAGGSGGGASVPASPAASSVRRAAAGGGAAAAAADGPPVAAASTAAGAGAMCTYEEMHAVVESMRLLALMDRSPDGLDVYVAFPKRVARRAALEAATTLRATYMMAYQSEGH